MISHSSKGTAVCSKCGVRYEFAPGILFCPECGNPRVQEDDTQFTNDDEADVSVLRLLGYFISALFFLFLLRLGWVVWHMTFLLK